MIRMPISRLRPPRGRRARRQTARRETTRRDAARRPRVPAPAFGILVALPEEFAAMRSFIGDPRRANVDGDRADYILGTMPSADHGRPHQVVLTMLGETGNDAAVSACTNLLR